MCVCVLIYRLWGDFLIRRLLRVFGNTSSVGWSCVVCCNTTFVGRAFVSLMDVYHKPGPE